MKKIISLLVMGILLTSCGLVEENEEMESKENNINTQVDSGSESDNNSIDNMPSVDTGAGVDTNKTEEEVVKEFEAELDSLFKLLEGDVQP